MGVGGKHNAPAAFTPGKDPVPTVQGSSMFRVVLNKYPLFPYTTLWERQVI